MRRWSCYLCHRTFVHGRLLAGHLMDAHGVAR